MKPGNRAGESLASFATLTDRFWQTVARRGTHTAFVDPEIGSITYLELGELVKRLSLFLIEKGVQPGDRIGIFMGKSVDAIALMLGVLQAQAIYVPLDPSVTSYRGAVILSNCQAKIVFVEDLWHESLRQFCEEQGYVTNFIPVNFSRSGFLPIRELLENINDHNVSADKTTASSPAYILYTSGSTGTPKGVVLTHQNADAFTQWCIDTLPLSENDRFSMHAPWHFDLSIFDIYTTIRLGGTGIIIPDSAAKNPRSSLELIHSQHISIWYSAPSALALWNQEELEKMDLRSLRVILFAGEPFPPCSLKQLTSKLNHVAYFNLYGPTETNVCTFYQIPLPLSDNFDKAIPIGKACAHSQLRISEEGELQVSGPTVMLGYWDSDKNNENAFVIDSAGTRWYRTGDLVNRENSGLLNFLGRLDRMIKKRGYRIEPAEIEHCLSLHPAIEKAAVLPLVRSDGNTGLVALLASGGETISILELKKHCYARLPIYMIPDNFIFLDSLPLTATSKVDFQKLKIILGLVNE